ncbi:MAG: site-specific integrase [Syntrophales bacterium]|jgi:integrase
MSVWKEERGWRYRFRLLGTKYNGSFFKTKREANAAETERRKVVKMELKKVTRTVFSEVANKYLDYSKRKHADQTYKYKAFVYASFIGHYDDMPIEAIRPQHIHEYLNTRPSNHNYNAHRKDLSALWTFANRQLGMTISNPCHKIDKMPWTPKNKVIPPEDVILKLIMAADPETDEQDLLLVVIHTLGRIDEVLRMKWDDVNFEKRTVTLWTRKRKDGAYESDALPMGDDLYEVLMKRWKEREQETWVFYNNDTGDRYYHRPKMMASLCKRAGIEPVGKGLRKISRGKNKGKYEDADLYIGFHALRHFMATYLADQEKVGVKAVSGLLRHKNLRTTEIYLHSIDESQRIAIDKIQGKFTSKNANVPTECSHLIKERAAK